jgi:hydroxymethylpyrimidine pyrophosphatase-like HAD family hydrolase
MIYASDLDQTLIYSTRAAGINFDSPLITPAETMNGQITSYISVQALAKLRQLAQEAIFIPVTTRTVEQYKRIEIFYESIKPKYAITSNGGNVLIDGEVDAEWNAYIRTHVADTSAPAADVEALFGSIRDDSWVVGERFCDELFYSIVIDREKMPMAQVTGFAETVRTLGWELSVQGRKIYIVPNSVSKRAGLEYVKDRLGDYEVVASGDSLLDRSLLELADHPIAPRHGELYREHLRDAALAPYTFTSASGILAADEIVEYAYRIKRSMGDGKQHQESMV